MKKILMLLVFLISLLEINAQQVRSRIDGHIENARSSNADYLFDSTQTWLQPLKQTVNVSNNLCSYFFELKSPTICKVKYGNEIIAVYTEPGNEIDFSMLEGIATSLKFDGKSGAANNFLLNYKKENAKYLIPDSAQSDMLNSKIDQWEIVLYKNMKASEKKLNESDGSENYSAAFKDLIQQTISYQYWANLLAYPIIIANNQPANMDVYPLPAEMLSSFSKIKVNNKSAFLSPAYFSFLKYYVTYFTSKQNGFKKFTDFNTSADRKIFFAKQNLEPDIFHFWLSQFIASEKDRLQPSFLKSVLNDLKRSDVKQEYYPALQTLCAERLAMKDEKAVIPATAQQNTPTNNEENYNLQDEKGKKVSLQSFKGKVVYVDFWASWCGPCRAMMPFSKSLHESLTEKEKKGIVFLYISIDENMDAWKKAKKDLGIQGVNYISPGNWQSKIARALDINSIPRYMIMDKKGNIVIDDAPRPNEPQLMEMLRKYLQ